VPPDRISKLLVGNDGLQQLDYGSHWEMGYDEQGESLSNTCYAPCSPRLGLPADIDEDDIETVPMFGQCALCHQGGLPVIIMIGLFIVKLSVTVE
jgi:hypothetical protein